MDILRDAGAAIWRADRVCGGACSCATGSFRGAGTIKGDIGGVDYCVDRCQANGVSTLSTGAVSTMSAGAPAASIAAIAGLDFYGNLTRYGGFTGLPRSSRAAVAAVAALTKSDRGIRYRDRFVQNHDAKGASAGLAVHGRAASAAAITALADRKSTRLNSSYVRISYAVFCLKKKTKKND